MNNKILIWSVTAALAGFLFGFDTVVISGVEKKLQSLWHSSDTFHGVVVIGMALWGTVIGALLGGIPTNKIGRKNTLILIGVLYTVSAIGSGLVNDPISFAVFRFLGGLGVGVSTVAAPAYISEIAPAKDRGKLVGLYQFNIVFGILIAFLSNYLLSDIGENAWRWMVGIEALPAILYTFFAMSIPKSPRWLLTKFKHAEAKKMLQTINTNQDSEKLMAEIEKDINSTAANENIFIKKYRTPLILAFLIAFFNQLSGINALLYYAPRILTEAGLEESSALLSSIGVGVVNLVFTLLGVTLIDRLGRKQLMYICSFGYIVSLSLVSMAFFMGWDGSLMPIFLFVFIAAHAIGQGTVIWVFISEIFPNHLRDFGQSFGSSIHWVLAAVVPSFVPVLFSSIGAGIVFLFFAIIMVFQLLFVIFMMPETKGVSLEELGKNLNTKKLIKPLTTIVVLATLILSCKNNTSDKTTFSEETLYRPNFHFTPKKNWMNDPNGMFFYNGYYHLYFQHHPESNIWGPMHWGHAISTDMISWTEQPIAIYPDDLGTIFSGSAVVDIGNTSGLGRTDKSAPVVAIYTNSKKLQGHDNWKQTQSIAFSEDEGKTFIKYEQNPVIYNDSLKDFRDPKVLWDEERNRWMMVLAAGDKIMFYTSKDLKQWGFLSDFGQNIGGHGGVWECPDFFKLSVLGTDQSKWVLFVSINPGGPNGGSATQYFVGDFDGKQFEMDEDFATSMDKNHNYWIDFGKDNYAGVSWSNAPTKDGSKLVLGWMSNWQYAQNVPTQGWRSAMTVARKVQLQKNENGYRLLSNPVKELDNYRATKYKNKDVSIREKTKIIDSKTLPLNSTDILLTISEITDIKYTFKLSNELGDQLLFGYDHPNEQFFVDRTACGKTNFSKNFADKLTTAPRTSLNKNLQIRVLIDKTSMELFFDNGETVMTNIFFLNSPFERLDVETPQQEFTINTIEAHKLKFNLKK